MTKSVDFSRGKFFGVRGKPTLIFLAIVFSIIFTGSSGVEHTKADGAGLYEVGAGKLYATIQSALNQLFIDQGVNPFTATQTIRVYDGTYNETVTPNATLVPTSSNRLVIEAADGNQPILDSGNTKSRAFSVAVTAGNLTIRGFIVRNYTTYAIRCDAVPNVIFNNNTLSSFSSTAVYFGHDGDNSLVYNNIIRDAGNGIELRTASGSTVYNNYVYGSTQHGIRLEAMTNSLLYNNLLVDNGDEGIRLITSSNNRVYNNTIYNVNRAGTRGGIFLVTTSPNNTLKNNIVWENGSVTDACIYVENAASQAGLVSDNNDLYATGDSSVGYLSGAYVATLSDWQTASGQDAHSLSANPLFLNADGTDETDFKLNDGSLCAEAGTDLSGVFTTDYFGSTRTVPWTLGIYELDVSPTPTPMPTATIAPSATSSPASSASVLPETGASTPPYAFLLRAITQFLISTIAYY